ARNKETKKQRNKETTTKPCLAGEVAGSYIAHGSSNPCPDIVKGFEFQSSDRIFDLVVVNGSAAGFGDQFIVSLCLEGTEGNHHQNSHSE
ncbi:hypothetical protein SDJN02_16092, partial [Cucurbita argyrosperma subsp. argyrosperma]